MASRGGKIAQVVTSVLILGAAAWIFFNHQFVLDRFAVWQYQPTQDIIELAERAQLRGDGEFYFYASRPSLSDRSEFHQQCGNQEEHAVILGCYVAQRIYVFDVEDERLEGVREVTAAHEMLHAAYNRLSQDERERVGNLLEQELETADDALLERLEVYDSLATEDKINELHSIIATEVDDIHPELEEYYAQYFSDRQVVVELFHSYESVFRELRDQQESLVAELNSLVGLINARTATYNTNIATLNAEIVSFNSRAGISGGFASEEEFEDVRSGLLARQQELEAEQVAIDAMRDEYDAKVVALDDLNLQQQSLQQSLDSSPSPVPSV